MKTGVFAPLPSYLFANPLSSEGRVESPWQSAAQTHLRPASASPVRRVNELERGMPGGEGDGRREMGWVWMWGDEGCGLQKELATTAQEKGSQFIAKERLFPPAFV